MQGEGSSIQNQKFYKSTLEAMRAKENAKHEKAQDAVTKPAVAQAESAEKPAVPVANVGDDMEEIPIAGRTKMTVPKKVSQDSLSTEQGSGSASASDSESDTKKTEEEEPKLDAKTELNDILKRAPSMFESKPWSSCDPSTTNYHQNPQANEPRLLVIIFSKSYCPYSMKAKHILLEGYTISPAPFVVELDKHPIGKEIQAILKETTGRGTVPNILVNGKSIGGGDDIAAMDQSDDLATRLREYGGKWVADVSRGPPKQHM
jgi:glutaredoxin